MKDRFISMRHFLSQSIEKINLEDIKNNLQKINEDIWVEYSSGDIIYSKDLDVYAQGGENDEEVEELINLALGKKVMILLNSRFDSEELGAVIIGKITKITKESYFVTEIYLDNNVKAYNNCKEDFSRCFSPNRHLYLSGHLLGIIELMDSEYQKLLEKFRVDPKSLVNNRIIYYK